MIGFEGKNEEGPVATAHVQIRCDGCKHYDYETYRAQGDSGVDHFCRHPVHAQQPRSRAYLDSGSRTPDWCPVYSPGDGVVLCGQLKTAIEAFNAKVRRVCEDRSQGGE